MTTDIGRITASEQRADAIVQIGAAAGLPTPTPVATWGVDEVVERVLELRTPGVPRRVVERLLAACDDLARDCPDPGSEVMGAIYEARVALRRVA